MKDRIKNHGIYYGKLEELVIRNPSIYYDVTTLPENIYEQLQFNLIKFVNNEFVNAKDLSIVDFKPDDRLYVLYALDNEPNTNYIDALLALSKNQIKVYIYCNDAMIDYFEKINLKVIGDIHIFLQNLNVNIIDNQSNNEDNNIQNTIENNQDQAISKKRGKLRK